MPPDEKIGAFARTPRVEYPISGRSLGQDPRPDKLTVGSARPRNKGAANERREIDGALRELAPIISRFGDQKLRHPLDLRRPADLAEAHAYLHRHVFDLAGLARCSPSLAADVANQLLLAAERRMLAAIAFLPEGKRVPCLDVLAAAQAKNFLVVVASLGLQCSFNSAAALLARVAAGFVLDQIRSNADGKQRRMPIAAETKPTGKARA